MNIKEEYEHLGNHAYVDGSFNASKFIYGSGIVIIVNNEIVHEQSLFGNDPILAKQRNVAGEMRAAMAAMKFAINNCMTSLVIHYDYLGIEKWVTGEWKRNNAYTKGYHEFMNKMMDDHDICVYFRKVKAHSNDKYNDRADELAKEGAQL